MSRYISFKDVQLITKDQGKGVVVHLTGKELEEIGFEVQIEENYGARIFSLEVVK